MKHWIKVTLLYNGMSLYMNTEKMLYCIPLRRREEKTNIGSTIYFSETDGVEIQEDIDTVMKLIEEAERERYV